MASRYALDIHVYKAPTFIMVLVLNDGFSIKTPFGVNELKAFWIKCLMDVVMSHFSLFGT